MQREFRHAVGLFFAVAGVAPATQEHCTSMFCAHLQHLSKYIP